MTDPGAGPYTRALATRDPPGASCHVLVVDDSRLYREGLVDLLSARLGPGTVRAADSLPALQAQLAAVRPAVVLVNLTSTQSADMLAAIRAERPGAQVVVVGVDDTDERQVIDCAEAGVSGYVTRDYSLADLIEVIDEMTVCGSHVSPRISSVLLRRVQEVAERRPEDGRLEVLTERESQILRLIGAGFSNQAIAHELTIELHTVKNHVHSLLTKLGVRRRGQAAALLIARDQAGRCG